MDKYNNSKFKYIFFKTTKWSLFIFILLHILATAISLWGGKEIINATNIDNLLEITNPIYGLFIVSIITLTMHVAMIENLLNKIIALVKYISVFFFLFSFNQLIVFGKSMKALEYLK